MVDLIGETNPEILNQKVDNIVSNDVSSFGEPFIAIQLKQASHDEITDKRALHSKIILNYMGKVKRRK
jgi:hypothetical protein